MGDEAHVSPIARRIAERLNVDLTQVKGTGRNGRISKEDVEAFAAQRGGPIGVQAGTVADSAPLGDLAATGNGVKRPA